MSRPRRLLVLPLLVGCPAKPAPPTPPDAVPREAAAAEAPQTAGSVVGGVYRDAAGRFQLPVPAGWSWTPGPPNAALQVRLMDSSGNLSLEVWRFPGNDHTLRPREGCAWNFVDNGPYSGPVGAATTRIGTCVPTDPTRPRVFGWVVGSADATWQLDGQLSPSVLASGMDPLQAAVQGFQLTDPSGS